ncbi:SWIM zinc finger family protein [Streptomyces sp. NBC_00124]|uniref:SWIM zinc finger family protein n=1 Tax=Streptomyces sp. NBC_00124 TaxID=2975662 RepID=UPI002259F5FE|nr:SWIM zinc finger family protein [Streptomyces sp. NBC_00124]MCX5359743.1 SWIM zinc finger family protein [Streptomyces sp. NBC_00124]
MTGRPADEVRRALREARERREAEGTAEGAAEPREPAGDGSVPGTSAGSSGSAVAIGEGPAARQPETGEVRPGDAARAALRRAAADRRGAGAEGPAQEARTPEDEADTPAGPDASASGPGEETDRLGDPPNPVPGAGNGGGAPQGARPADRAREALRAARAEERRLRTEVTGGGTDGGARPRRTTLPAPVARGGPAGGTAAERARAVRESLADAFRMPDDEADQRSSADWDRDPVPADASQDTGPDPYGTGTGPAPLHAHAAFGTALSDSPPPAAPRRPRSMGAPGRDGELRRTFPAFTARASGEDGGFAETWWGNAWVDALERGALDAKRLARGRGYAEQGNVDAITVTPGLVLAYVQGSRPRPYRVQVRLRTLDDADWDRFLDAAAERTGHIAALLDKEMPHALAEGGVRLLPGPGDLEPQCSCPDRGHPCKHAAALCYQTARLLDADPFVLLLLRGRGERELLDALSRLSAARAARAAQDKGPAPLPGVRATEALAPRRLPPLPAPLPVPPHPEQPPVYPAAPGGPDPFALDQLATDAAGRAHALLGTGRDPVAELTLWQDAVRLAAARPGSGLTAATRSLYASLAAAADRTPADLARAVAAWRQGGFEGLAVLEEPWDPPAGRFDRARPLLLAADLPAFRPWRNRLTHPRGHVQLRLGRDGLWYAYESDPGADDWWPRGTPDLDPVGALTGLGASPEG